MPEHAKSKPFTVLVVDDHTMFRQALVCLMETRPDRFCVVGEAQNSCEALSLAHDARPDLVLLDLGLPDCNGIDIIDSLREELPDAKIIMLSAFDDGQYVYDAICEGAAGFLTKNLSAQQLFDQLESAMKGFIVFTPDSVTQFSLLVTARDRQQSAQNQTALTGGFDAFDNEIIRLVSEGKTNDEIGRTVHASTHTVKVHLSAILAALRLENRTQLAVYAKTHVARTAER